MWIKFFLSAFAIIAVAIGGVYGTYSYGRHMFYAPGPLENATFFEIPRGANLSRVATHLKDDGVISSDIVFRLGAEITNQQSKIRFGSFEIPANASMAEILAQITKPGAEKSRYTAVYRISEFENNTTLTENVPGTDDTIPIAAFNSGETVPDEYSRLLQAGHSIEIRVAIAEGLTSLRIVEGLLEADFLKGEIAEIPNEGELGPDTYGVALNSSRSDLVGRLRSTQKKILAEAWENRALDTPLGSAQEALILASIVEKETGVNSERGLVASVFVNRLKIGMRLQSDPTVIYGVTDGKGSLGRGLRKSELERETPYNTYKISGLPPTPISNPGREAILAALNPTESEYLYFVADGTGGHAFATSYRDHRKNVQNWRKLERANKRGDQ